MRRYLLVSFLGSIFFFYQLNLYILKNKFRKRSFKEFKLRHFASTKIPHICYQTWKTNKFPNSIQCIMDNNKLNNPNIKFILMNDDDIDSFISNNFDKRVYKAFKFINSDFGAAKADFFRYCILYINGGIYLDIKSSINNILKYINEDDICILDKPRRWIFENHRGVLGNLTHEQWLLIFCKGHPYLKTMINQMTNNILDNQIPVYISKKKQVKERIFRLTGPDAFTVAIKTTITNYGLLHREIYYFKFAKICSGKWYNINESRPMYKYSNITHYSKVNEPIIQKSTN